MPDSSGFQCLDKDAGVLGGIRLNGQMAGQVWNTMGDDVQRKFDYVYDNAGRLSNANFNERATVATAWIKTKMDFSTSGTTFGRIDYDLNGNIKEMTQRGVLMANQNAQTIDDLRYTYKTYSNQLLKVVTKRLLPGKMVLTATLKMAAVAQATTMCMMTMAIWLQT